MSLRFDRAILIASKDWEEVFENKITLLSIILPYIIPVAFPLLILVSFRFFGSEIYKYISEEEFELMSRIYPALSNMDILQASIYIICVLLIPLLFIVFSLASTSIITADSFAGEKERKTLEALFASPLSDAELFMGKLLASIIPSIILTYLFYGITIVLVNLLTLDIFGYIWYPPLEAGVTVFIITPLYAFLGMTLVIWGSSRSGTVRDASNYAGILILPILFFVISALLGYIIINVIYLLLLALVLGVLDILAFIFSYRTFDRERLITRI